MRRIIGFIALLVLCVVEIVSAQCPGGNCYRYSWGTLYYPGNCSNGRCYLQKKVEAKEPEDPEPELIKPFCVRVIELVNQSRQQAGLPSLQTDETLCKGCNSHSIYMRSYGFGHAYGIGGRECIAMGVRTPEAVVKLWLNSSGHRAILLGNGKLIGVGFSGTFWTLRVR